MLLWADLRVNAEKNTLCFVKIEYFGIYLPMKVFSPSKMQAILAVQPPTSGKQLWIVPSLVQCYKDIWEKRSKVLAPLTNLVGKWSHAKVTKKKATKKKMFHKKLV